MTDVLCGAHRAGHFDSVATAVTKLLVQASAGNAFFGEKDFQRLQLVRRLVRYLGILGDVVGSPTIREDGGLVISSRNLLLSDPERIKTAMLYEIMTGVSVIDNIDIPVVR